MGIFTSQLVPLVKLGLLHPGLARLALQVKQSGKTYLNYSKLLSLVENYIEVYRRNSTRPHIAEFGVGRGGSAIILAWMVNRYGGYLTLFDVFGRIPAPTYMDGEEAIKRYQTIMENESQSYYGNLPDLLSVIKAEISAICPLDRIEFVQGRYEDILPIRTEERFFDLVHVDCDWYESARIVQSFLERNTHPGAILQIDDYFYWKGAREATDEVEWLKPFYRRAIGNALVIDTSRFRE